MRISPVVVGAKLQARYSSFGSKLVISGGPSLQLCEAFEAVQLSIVDPSFSGHSLES